MELVFSLEKESGVAKRLSELYTNIVIWHCLNHRLELSIADTADEIGSSSIQHFRFFMNKLYSLYSQFPKNARELEEHA